MTLPGKEDHMMQAKTPDLARFLARIPDEGRLEYLKDTLGQRASTLARADDPESGAWASLYMFMVTELESALLARRCGVTI